MARDFKTDESKPFTIAESDLFGGGDPDVTYTLKYLTPQAQEAIARTVTAKFKSRRAMTPTESLEMATANNRELLDKALVGWSGITVGGEPAECVLANKILMPVSLRRVLLQKAGVVLDANEVPEAEGADDPDSFRPPA